MEGDDENEDDKTQEPDDGTASGAGTPKSEKGVNYD